MRSVSLIATILLFTDESEAVLPPGGDERAVVGAGSGRRLGRLPAAVARVRRPQHAAGRLHLRLVHYG